MTNHRIADARITSKDYRSLLGEMAWSRLHPHIQHRFSLKYLETPVTYTGVMKIVYLSRAGKLLAQVCRLIGKPLALQSTRDVPVSVEVYPDRKRGGVTWERVYNYRYHPADKVVSTKCIYPELGLVELIGSGFGMQLSVSENRGAIVFESDRYFWQLGRLRIDLPKFLKPGKTTVAQTAFDDGSFEFRLNVDHRWLGKVCSQRGIFREEKISAR